MKQSAITFQTQQTNTAKRRASLFYLCLAGISL